MGTPQYTACMVGHRAGIVPKSGQYRRLRTTPLPAAQSFPGLASKSAMLIGRHVPPLPSTLPFGHRQIGLIAIGAAAALGFACYAYFRPRTDANEIERRRRIFLAEYGRITDATLIDTNLGDAELSEFGIKVRASGAWTAVSSDGDPVPSLLIYAYRVSGVSYECAQDVSLLADQVRHVRVDLPIQVRYDPHNPSNSIVVAESWSGLRLDPNQL
jgi:hypothetical protein